MVLPSSRLSAQPTSLLQKPIPSSGENVPIIGIGTARRYEEIKRMGAELRQIFSFLLVFVQLLLGLAGSGKGFCGGYDLVEYAPSPLETPFLVKYTPGGARNFLVPARLADWVGASSLWKLADFQSNAALIIGTGMRAWREIDFGAQTVERLLVRDELARLLPAARAALGEGDVAYLVTPQKADLWRADTVIPRDLAVRLIGTEDDVELRRAVRAVLLARLSDPSASISDPAVALLQNAAQARLDYIVASDASAADKSRAAGLLGVIGLARLVSETQDRVAALSSTVTNLQLAIELDPSNHDAKYNLELALQRARGTQLTEGAGGQNPSPGGSGSSGAGAGDPGSGY
jgi:hypothetical protein